MTAMAWLYVALALVAGIAVGAAGSWLVTRRAATGPSRVPHRVRQVLRALSEGAVVIDRQGRAVFSNSAASALGIAQLDGPAHPGLAELARHAWDEREAAEAELEVERGIQRDVGHVRARVTPLDAHLALAIATDSSDTHAAEAARRDFAVNVSHELKTPVGALALLAESIEMGADDPVMVREFAAKIRGESVRLTRLVQEIIQISRLQGADAVATPVALRFADIVGEAIDHARLAAEAKRIGVSVVGKAAPTVLGDRELLVMAVRNLVDNAIAYSEPGEKVTVTLDEAEGLAAVSVLDHGIGIDPKEADRVFERFYRVDAARSRDTGGTGLGLSIVKHVAAQHGGTVDLWSRPGVGSTFTIRLPLHEEGS